jgi:hypothetical protein
MLVLGAVAAAHLAARQAESRLDPRVSETQTLLTSCGRVWLAISRRIEVFAEILFAHRRTVWAGLEPDRVSWRAGRVARHTSGREPPELVLGQQLIRGLRRREEPVDPLSRRLDAA